MTNLRVLDRAKGLAVIGVLMVHVSQMERLFYANKENVFGRITTTLIDNGARGVQLFFIVSGYSLALNYGRYVVGSHGVLRFYLARFFRIYPLWIFTIFCYLILYGKSENFFLNASFIFGFLRWQNPNPEIVIGGWSLFCEVFYYACFPLLFRFMKISAFHTLSVIVLSMASRIFWLEFASKLGIPDTNSFVGLFPPSNFYAFVLGIAIYTLKPEIEKRSAHRRKFFLYATGICFFALGLPEIEQMFITLLMAAIVATYQVKDEQSFRVRLLEEIGKRCYAIYLLQFLLIRQFEDLFKSVAIPQNVLFLPVLILILFLLLGLGHLVSLAIEKPSINLGRKLAKNLGSR